MPVRAPFLEVLPGKFLENQSSQDVVGGRIIDIVGWYDVILFGTMLQLDVESERLARALNVQRDGIAAIGFSGQQVAKTQLPIERVDVVPVLVDLVVADRRNNVARLQARLGCRLLPVRRS